MAIPPFNNTRLNKHEEPTKEKQEELFDAITRNFGDLYSMFPLQREDMAESFLKLAAGGSRKIAFGSTTCTFSGSGVSGPQTVEHGLGAVPLLISFDVEGGLETEFVSQPRVTERTASKFKFFMNGAAAYTRTYTIRWAAIA